MKIAGLDLSITSSGCVVMELDDKFNVINIERHGFCKTLKQQTKSPDMVYYNLDDFNNFYERYEFFNNHLMEWCKDCDYIAVEDYAYDAKGFVFDLAEFEGNIKMNLWRRGKTLRFYPPGTHKKFFTGHGDCHKLLPYETYLKYTGVKFDISDLPPVVDDKKGAMPTSDILDAYALCELLRHELIVKNNKKALSGLTKKQAEVFTTKSKTSPNGLIELPWDIKGAS